MITGFIFVFLGNVLRLGAGLLVFVLLARLLGPQGFGAFSYALALATLASIPVNFGLGAMVLRGFGATPDQKLALMSSALSARLVLALGMLALCSLFGIALLDHPWAVFLPLLLAQIFETFSELYGLSFRASSSYRAEATTASMASLVHLVAVSLVAWWWRDVSFAAWAFCGSRALGLVLTIWAASRAFQPVPLSGLRAALALLRGAWAYAVELGLSTAYTQMDSVLIQAVLGLKAVGLYQSGMKLVQGFSRLAPILALYILPRLTARMQPGSAPATARATAGLTVGIFVLVGLLSGGLLAVAAGPITHTLFGPAYAELAHLLPFFGALLALRFSETGCGLVLVALNLQHRKVWLVALQFVLMLCVGSWAVRAYGLQGWLLTSIFCTLLLLLLYSRLWAKTVRQP